MEGLVSKCNDSTSYELIKSSKPELDFDSFEEIWIYDNVLQSLAYNAISVLFPSLEREVVSVMRDAAYKSNVTIKLKQEVLEFCKQEGMHSKYHEKLNDVIISASEKPKFNKRKKPLEKLFQNSSDKDKLLLCVLFETIASTLTLVPVFTKNRKVNLRVAKLWAWHALEELNHRYVAYDLYVACYGSYSPRVRLVMKFYLLSALSILRVTSMFFFRRKSRLNLFNYFKIVRYCLEEGSPIRLLWSTYKIAKSSSFHPDRHLERFEVESTRLKLSNLFGL